MLLGWSTRRLNDLVTRRFRTWRERAADIHLLPLYVLGRGLIANLFGLGLILWLGLFSWTFNLIGSDPVQFILRLWSRSGLCVWLSSGFRGFLPARRRGGCWPWIRVWPGFTAAPLNFPWCTSAWVFWVSRAPAGSISRIQPVVRGTLFPARYPGLGLLAPAPSLPAPALTPVGPHLAAPAGGRACLCGDC